MQLNRVVGSTADEVRGEIEAALDRNKQYIGKETEHLALIVEGKSLIMIMDDPVLSAQLLTFGQMCKAVVACRVSPNQKRQIVAMVRNGVKPAPMTLAIGDGANDVPMIMEAHVGVGISGNEGLQAVRSADYAIAQFRFLKRLLLVHGRNNYIRVCRLVLYIFYKNTVCVTSLFLFNIYMGWSGTTLFASFLSMSYNVFFTGVPIIVFGFLEQDIKDTNALKTPQLYIPGQRKESFNVAVAASWGLNALIHTLLVFFLPMGVLVDASTVDLYVAGTIVMMALVAGINARLLLMQAHISQIAVIVTSVSVGLLIIIILLMSVMNVTTFDIHFYYGAGTKALGNALVWLSVILTVVAMMVVDMTHMCLVCPYPPPPQPCVRVCGRIICI